MRAALVLLVLAGGLALGGCGSGDNAASGPAPEASKRMGLSSPYFGFGHHIPKRFTCDGEDVSPSLEWRGVPPGDPELAVLVEDPEGDRAAFVHWLAWGISPKLNDLPADPDTSGFKQAKNSFGKVGYGGPCPPKGDKPHRYVFNVYALRKPLGLKNGADAQTARQAIATVADAQGKLEATYGR
jgi:Raf kinase inhibitor-like YbhB/YbcL family protein